MSLFFNLIFYLIPSNVLSLCVVWIIVLRPYFTSSPPICCWFVCYRSCVSLLYILFMSRILLDNFYYFVFTSSPSTCCFVVVVLIIFYYCIYLRRIEINNTKWNFCYTVPWAEVPHSALRWTNILFMRVMKKFQMQYFFFFTASPRSKQTKTKY